MPTYEYFCEHHKTIEVQQSINDPVLEECPLCLENNEHTSVIKQISICTFHLSGGGWADTGYK